MFANRTARSARSRGLRAVFGALLYASSVVAFATSAAAGTLTVAQSYDPQSLWPNFSTSQENINAANPIVESLLWLDPATNKVMFVLAESYKLDDDKTIRLSLRQGVKFTNGEPMDADAVVASINVFLDKNITPAFARDAAKIEKAEKVDDHTVLVHLKQPYPAIDLLLSQIFIVPPKYWAEAGPARFGRAPIGTGPYVLKEWVRDDRLVMERNPGFWGTPPKGIDTIIWKPVPDDTARAAGLLAGEYDVAANIPVTAIDQIKANANLDLVSVPSYRIFKIDFSTLDIHPSPLHKKLVRQALNYAVDKQAIRESLFFGMATPLHGQLLRSNQLGFNAAVEDYPYDQQKAKALLAEAGYPNGLDITFKFPSGRYAQDKEVAEAIAGMLSEVGVRLNMVTLEAGEFLNQLNQRRLNDMALRGSAPQDDPDAMLSAYLSDWRYAYINDKKLDEYIHAGAKEMDSQKRAKIYQDAMAHMREEAYMIYLYQANDVYGKTKKVQNFVPRGDQRWAIYDMSIE